jgi:hypothetical protein
MEASCFKTQYHRNGSQRQVYQRLLKETSFCLISFRFCQISLRHRAKWDESGGVIVCKRWEKMQGKDTRQGMPFMPLNYQDTRSFMSQNAKSYSTINKKVAR